MRNVVDLPQPDGPTRTRNSPSITSRLKSLTATTLWKRLLTCSNSTRAMPLPLCRAREDALHEEALEGEEHHQWYRHRDERRCRQQLIRAAKRAHEVGDAQRHRSQVRVAEQH